MARFESGWQIFGFLLGAAVVSLAVIEVLKVEAVKRYGDDDVDVGVGDSAAEAAFAGDGDTREAVSSEAKVDAAGLKERLKNRWKRLIDWFHGGQDGLGGRKKRSIEARITGQRSINPPVIPDEKYPYIPNELPVQNPDSESPKLRAPEIFIETIVSDPKPETDREDKGDELGANLLVEAVNGRRVRHLREKIEKLDPADPVVEAILSKFCIQSSHGTSEEIIEDPPFEANVEDAGEFEDESFFSHFPPMLDNRDDFPIFEASEAVEDDGFKFVCRSYGDLYLTVVVTTVVNFSVMGLVLLCRSVIRTKRRNQRSLNFYQNNLAEHCEQTIFKTSSSEHSPIIKSMAEDYKI